MTHEPQSRASFASLGPDDISSKQKPGAVCSEFAPLIAHFFCGIDRRDFEARSPLLSLLVLFFLSTESDPTPAIRHLPARRTAHLAGRRDQMLLRLAFGAAPRPPLPANVPPLARAYTLVMVDRAQDGEHQALGELSSSSLSFNWGGDTAEMDPTFGHLPTFGGLPTGMAHPFPLRRALWFEGYLRERPVSDPVEMRRHDGAPLRQPRGPASARAATPDREPW